MATKATKAAKAAKTLTKMPTGIVSAKEFAAYGEAAIKDVVKYSKTHGVKWIKEISKQTKAAYRAAVVASIEESVLVAIEAQAQGIVGGFSGLAMAPLEQANLAINLIGLDERAAKAVIGYRKQLMAEGMNLVDVNKKVKFYARKKLRERAATIARTETMTAINSGYQEAMVKAQKEGLLGKRAMKVLDVVLDSKTCKICEPLEGQRAYVTGKGSKFKTSVGNFTNPPFHVNCRCTIHPLSKKLVL